jgi:hypothetical protein
MHNSWPLPGILTLTLFFGLFNGCKKQSDNELVILEGNYSGIFEYQGTSYWSSIEFENNHYTEWPSGGAYYQKNPECLTVGTYSFTDYSLIFHLDSFKYSKNVNPCNGDMLLPGEYTVLFWSSPDSLVFEQGTGLNHIIYYLLKENE